MGNKYINGDFFINNDILLKYKGSDKIIKIPDGVKMIGTECFEDNEYIKEVILPKSCTQINEFAFNNCINLEKINLENIQTIQGDAFRNCGFKEIELKNKENIEEDAFAECDKLKKAKIINCTYISDPFADSGIEEIYLSNNIVEITNCPKLKKITIEDELEYQEINEIIGCDNPKLVEIIAPNVITENGVVYNKDKTTLIKYLESKENEIFKMPNSINEIETYGIYQNKYLKELYFSENIKTLKSLSINLYKLEKIIFNKNIEKIEKNALNSYASKLYIEIPSNVDINVKAIINSKNKKNITIKIKKQIETEHESIKFFKEYNPNVTFKEARTLEELIEEGKSFHEASRIMKNYER